MPNEAPNPDLLPTSVRDLVDAYGWQTVERLLRWRGGAYCNIPVKWAPHYALCRVLPKPAAQALISTRGGEQIHLPRCDALLRHQRNAEIVRRRLAGEPEAVLVVEYGIGTTTLRDIMRRHRAEEAKRQAGFDF
jgi:hypothetical protein